MSKKRLLAELLFRRLKYVTVPLCNIVKPRLFYVLAYHRVWPMPSPDYPFLDGMVSATPNEFEEQLRFIKSRFNVINFRTLSDILSTGEILPDDSLIISFDDGYADNYEHAYGLLRKYGLTATIFVSTSFIDSGQPLWFDKSAYIINTIPEGVITLASGKHEFEVTSGNRRETIRAVRNLFQSVPNEDRLRLLAELEDRAGTNIASDHLELAKPLSWRQIREMSDYGIEIGSHTVTHPYLTRLAAGQLKAELLESKRILEENTGREVKSVAYPAGIYDGAVVECAKDCGYQFGVSYDHAVRRLSSGDMYAIPRIHIEADVSLQLFQAYLLLPQLFVR